MYELEKELWSVCKICNANIKELAKKYGGGGFYHSEVFIKHLEIDHNLTIKDYCKDVLQIEIPKCECNICGQEVSIYTYGSKIRFSKYRCGRNPGILKWAEQAKESRKGVNNPAFSKAAWNKGLNKDNNEIMAQTAKNAIGRITSEKTKEKQAVAARARTVKCHTTPHTEESKQKMREATLRRISDGEFKHTKTKPHIRLSELLNELDWIYEEEAILSHWSFDFYIPALNLYIEVDGDYFHSNPKIYPNGPKTNTQKINWYRDLKKNKYCRENNIELIRFWECDVLNDGENIKGQLCKLKESLQLEKSA